MKGIVKCFSKNIKFLCFPSLNVGQKMLPAILLNKECCLPLSSWPLQLPLRVYLRDWGGEKQDAGPRQNPFNMHIKGMISVSPDSCIYPYTERQLLSLTWDLGLFVISSNLDIWLHVFYFVFQQKLLYILVVPFFFQSITYLGNWMILDLYSLLNFLFTHQYTMIFQYVIVIFSGVLNSHSVWDCCVSVSTITMGMSIGICIYSI